MTTPSTISRELAEFVSRTTFDQLPRDVVHETKRILLDVIGCALGSGGLEKGRIAVDFARLTGGRSESTILGTADKVPAALAAFANAELIHATDHCPILPPAHISPYVTSPALAVAEAERAPGAALVLGVAVAHEVASRVGLSLDSMRIATGGIAPTWGLSFDAFGAAAGAAKIFDLSTTATTDALGLAGYLAPVPSHNKFLSTPEGGGMAKYGPAGWTSQGGVTAAVLAKLGYQGDRTVLDGEHGFAAMAGSSQFHTAAITEALGTRWNLLRVMYKRWPCAGNLQAPLGAFTKLIEDHGLAAHEIDAVHVENEAFALQPRFLFDQLRHNVDTQTNLAYNLAMAAHLIPVSSAWQSRGNRENPSVREFMRKVTIEANPRAEETRHQELVVEGREYIERRPCLVRVRARGTEFSQAADYAYWLTIENERYRASDDDLVRKFRANASACLSPAAIDRAAERILSLEKVDDVSELFADLVPADTRS
ncbi:MmgE/PrpD family protein [Amycolatopsis sp. NPDC051371]|uniref:MmgE/PrpD family protein n=1 Tax=Amycolatopsis sp. NPDC051371 TaxID=3155800 RepID=UPI003426CEF5